MQYYLPTIAQFIMTFDSVHLRSIQQEFSLSYSEVVKAINELIQNDAVSYVSGFTYKVHKDMIMAWISDGVDINDKLFLRAIWFCIISENVSASRLQQDLSISYALATRFIEKMDKLGFISYSERKVLMTPDDYILKFGFMAIVEQGG